MIIALSKAALGKNVLCRFFFFFPFFWGGGSDANGNAKIFLGCRSGTVVPGTTLPAEYVGLWASCYAEL